MPRNSSGVYSLPAGNPVVNDTVIDINWANPTLADLANEITLSLPRNGSAGMTGPLMLFRDGINPLEAVPLQQLNAGLALYLPLTGGALSGALTLSGNAASALHAVPLQQLQATDATAVHKTGDETVGGVKTFTSNMVFSGAGLRIKGDFSNATLANRVFVQTGTSGGNTSFGLLPDPANATPITTFEACLSSDPANSTVLQAQITTTDARINSGARGTGGYLPMTFYTGGAERMRLDTAGVLTINRSSGFGLSDALVLSTSAGAANDGSSIKWVGAAGGEKIARIDGVQEGTDTGSLRFLTGNGADSFSERVRIDSAGNVGIGVTPTSRLHVKGPADTIVRAEGGSGTSFGAFYAQAATTGTSFMFFGNATSGERGRIYVDDAASLIIATGSSALTGIHINSSQQVGIGGNLGSESLRVNPSASAANHMAINGAATGASPVVYAEGSDANISFVLQPKGTGVIVGTGGLRMDSGGINVQAGAYFIAGTSVVGSRKTGWAAATGTPTRTTFATSTVTTAQLAERVKALIDDLISHGLIGT